MKIHNVEQGTEEWFKLKLGVPTASNFYRLVSPTGQLSKQIDGFSDELAIQKYTRKILGHYTNTDIQRGIDTESQAASYYQLITDADVKVIGFVTNDDETIGASPDRFSNDGLLEIKCPRPENHLNNLRNEMDNKYIPQIQGQMWVCEKEWCDFMSYSEGLPPLIKRVYRDDAFIKKLEEQSKVLLEKIEEVYEFLTEKGKV